MLLIVPGVRHVPALHASTRELSPKHMPPNSSSTDLVLVSVLVPIPQLTEQVPRIQEFQVQSTEVEMQRNYLSHLCTLLCAIHAHICTYTYDL